MQRWRVGIVDAKDRGKGKPRLVKLTPFQETLLAITAPGDR